MNAVKTEKALDDDCSSECTLNWENMDPVDLARLCVIDANYERALWRIKKLFDSSNNYSLTEMSKLAELVLTKECDDIDLHNKASRVARRNLKLCPSDPRSQVGEGSRTDV
jgi:hypothetical protein